eukprot:scaffold2266_cov166-Ochromonas_danica.AAC.4
MNQRRQQRETVQTDAISITLVSLLRFTLFHHSTQPKDILQLSYASQALEIAHSPSRHAAERLHADTGMH